MKRLLCLLMLLCLPGAAWADRGTGLQLLGAVITLASGGAGAAFWWGAALSFAGGLVRSSDARRAQRRLAAKQRQEYNDKLEARNVTVLTSDPPYRVGYGRCTGGGDVLAVFTTDKNGVTEIGTGYTKADGFRHLVIHYSSREIEAIHDVIIDGVRVGALDGDGYPTGGEFLSVRTETRNVGFTGSITLPEPASAILAAHKVEPGTRGVDGYIPVVVTLSSDGLTISTTETEPVYVDYTLGRQLRAVRISKFLGGPDQAVDAYLHSVIPDKWTANHRLRGLAGIVITLDLEDQRFQGGLPNILVDASWSKVYDPRLDSTQPGGSGPQRADQPSTWAWNDTAAVCVRDHLCGEAGLRCDSSIDIGDAATITAANACDVVRSFDDGSGPYTGKTYTCNGTYTSEQGAEAVLEDLTEAMAGAAVPAGQWQIIAGAWTPAVRDLVDDDLHGSIELLQADTGMGDLLNTARGRFIASGETQPADAKPPYTNPVLVAADQGEELAADFTFPFTNTHARARQLLRIKVERTRNGLMIRYPGKLRLWGLRVGERVTVTSRTYGWVRKVFRITDRAYTQGAPVDLVLQEDAAEIWDDVDAGTADATPNTGLPNPNVVGPVAGLSATSSSATLLTTADGTVAPQVVVAWDAITVPYMLPGGQVLVRWRRALDVTWRDLPPLLADTRRATITGMAEGEPVVVEVVLRNALGRRSDARFAAVRAVGKSDPPANVAGFSGSVSKGRLAWAWTPAPDADYAATEVRSADADWGSLTVPPLARVNANGWAEVVTAAATATRYARHFDASGNASTATASASVVVTTGDLVADGAPGDPGAAGASVYRAVAYIVSSTVPSAAPSGGTFAFATGVLTPPSGYTATRPAATTAGAVYSVEYLFLAAEPTDTVTAGAWTAHALVAAAVPLPGPVSPGPWPVNVTGTATPTTCVAGVRFSRDGHIRKKASGSSSTYNLGAAWHEVPASTVGDAYYLHLAQASLVGAGTLGGLGDSLALSSDRTVTLTATAGNSADAVVSYRMTTDAAGELTVQAGQITLHAEST